METCKDCVHYGEYILQSPTGLPRKVKMGCVHPVADMYEVNPAEKVFLKGCAAFITPEQQKVREDE